MYFKFMNFLMLFLCHGISTEDKRLKQGLPNGFLSDCEGSTKEAIISNKSLKHLQIAVLGHGNALTAKKTIYNYHQMKELAANSDFSKKIFMYMPGYIDHISFPVSPLMGIQYKKLGYNVWILEYSAFSLWFYPVAVRLLRPVGLRVAEMLANLTKYGMDPKKFHLAGISHGGQGISFIAKSYRQITGRNLSHLIGLDPSGPCFRNLGPEHRLDSSDADFVEVIHSNIDGYGMPGRMGHIDFYINGGEYQPADIPTIPCDGFCSHVKTFFYWVAAVNNPKCFIAMKCDSIQDARDRKCYNREPMVTNYLGEYVNKSRQGIFYVPIHYEYPYCMGKKGLILENNIYIKDLTQANKVDVLVL
ncbi:phospholipase A1 [Manduca sexta]|uniref:phospholipase A1 n=1 Tax=Manduca sexta TaxID=7130 RepID=UPI0011821BDE|nr:phospholipase A1 [Manduca sexta]